MNDTEFNIPQPTEFELHLNSSSTLPKQFGKLIKSLGGTYRDCRGHSSIRFVFLPNTFKGRELGEVLIANYGVNESGKGTPIIFRGYGVTNMPQAWITVHYVKTGEMIAHAIMRYEEAVKKYVKMDRAWALRREIIKPTNDERIEQLRKGIAQADSTLNDSEQQIASLVRLIEETRTNRAIMVRELGELDPVERVTV